MEISDVMWEAMAYYYRETVRRMCEEYETNPKYHVTKVIEGIRLVGFSVYYDENDYRFLEAGYYIGEDKMRFMREWHRLTRGQKKLRANVQRANLPMIRFYKKMGFKIIDEDFNNILFERYYGK
jgi:RimJ/RimL family protein N-acetyltransferase